MGVAGIAAHAHQDSQRDINRKHMRSAVTHKRQGGAGNRHYPYVHSDVNEKMSRQKYRRPDTIQRFKIAPSQRGDPENSPNYDSVKKKNKKRSDKTPLFGKSGKNKVGLMFRQEFQPALAAKAYSFAKKAARADGDHRLQSVITGSSRVSCRVNESQNTGFLIRFEDKEPGRCQSYNNYQKNSQEMFFVYARHQHHSQPD